MNTPLWVNSAGVAVGAWLVACSAGWMMALALAVSGPRVQRLGWLTGAITLALPPFDGLELAVGQLFGPRGA